MKSVVVRFLALGAALSLALALAGCASYDGTVAHGRSLSGYERYFVLRNHNDDRHIDAMIGNALRARGLKCSEGFATMMPEDAQVQIAYEDRWTWDAKNHLVTLRLTFRDLETHEIVAAAHFNGPTAINITPAEAVEGAITKLFGPPKN